MQYDIIIVGGGMVGASLACALKDTSLKIALIDASPHAAIHDARLIALTYGSCNLLTHLGLWPALTPHAEPIKQLHVSHRGHFGIARIHASDINLKTLGHLVPAKYINIALEEQLQHLSHIDIIRPATLKELTFEKNDPNEQATLTIQTATGTETLHGQLIIGADGTQSTVRELLNIKTKTIDYDQSAIVTITELQRHHQNIAYERFQSSGAIAMLPLTDQRCATIWTAPNKDITHLMTLTNDEFVTTLQTAFGYRLGRFIKIHQRHQYPLKLILADESQKHNVVLIGNAAHTMHPIAAQGFNVALQEVAGLAEQLRIFNSTHNTSVNPTDRPYAFSEFINSLHTTPAADISSVKVSHHLTWLFSSDLFITNIARQLGLMGLDICKPLKKFFLYQTMGRTGNIPPLLREKDDYENNSSRH